jgi:alginate O-acetyltransferase complex protein AlgJ
MSEKDPSNPSSTRRHHVTREEEADRSLNHTGFGPGSMALVTALFLLTVFGVPVVQHVVEIRQNLAKRTEWRPESGQPEPGLLPKAYTVGSLLPTGEQIGKAKGFWGYWSLIPSSESIVKFEEGLKESSVLTQALLSPAQGVMSGVFGVGNEKAYLGQPGWLFYRPDVDYVTASGFLRPDVLRARQHAANEVQPDPIKAILATRDQLKERGIRLVIMPVPTKPLIHPEKLIGDKGLGLQLQNPSYRDFVARLEQEGIPVYDPTAKLLEGKPKAPQYLETDTHWTPKAMGSVADDLAEFLKTRCELDAGEHGYTVHPTEVEHLGDIAEMLKLPMDQTLFKPQRVTIDAVQEPDGTPWQLRPEGDVLLLGDSFANIFSLEGMGWGQSAGLAERLSYALQRPVDKIVINAGGAFSSRQDLQARLKRGDDRLAGKKVVVWEFCMRDLAQGDWKLLDLPKPKAGSGVPTPVAQEGLTVTGRIAERATTPAPGSVPYKDCVIALHLTDLKVEGGTIAGKDILVYVWGMRDNQAVDGAFGKGQTVTLTLTPWSKAETKYGGYNRQELDSDDSLLWDAFWGEVKK